MSESARPAPSAQSTCETKVSPEAPARRGEATEEGPLAMPWVALLEDDEDQGALLCHWIRPILDGPELHWFRRADELVAYMTTARQDAPCLLVCDYELGDGDALSVMQRVAACRHAGRGAAVTVVVVSAHTDPARRAAVLRAGATTWLTKPLSRGDVTGAVRELIAGWRGPHSAARLLS